MTSEMTFVANQNSDVVSAYALDEDASALRPLGTLTAPTPVCVLPT
jgi:6-phosphogluconolactonase (cycloisomerase 2 family)